MTVSHAALPAAVSKLSIILAELDTLIQQGSLVPGDQRACAEQFQVAAARLLTFTTFLLREDVTAACRNAAAGHRKLCIRLPEADQEDAVQEAALRVLMRMRNLSEVPIRDIPAYAFMTLGRVLAASLRSKSRSRVPVSVLPEVAAEQEGTSEFPDSWEVESFLEGQPAPLTGLPLAAVYRAMVSANGKKAVAAEAMQLGLGQFNKLWAAVVSIVRARFRSAQCHPA